MLILILPSIKHLSPTINDSSLNKEFHHRTFIHSPSMKHSPPNINEYSLNKEFHHQTLMNPTSMKKSTSNIHESSLNKETSIKYQWFFPHISSSDIYSPNCWHHISNTNIYFKKCTFTKPVPEGHTETFQLTFIPQVLAWYIQYQHISSSDIYSPNCWHHISNTNIYF